MSSVWFDRFIATSLQGNKVVKVRRCGSQQTSSNLLETQHYRDSKVWRGLSHEFVEVQLGLGLVWFIHCMEVLRWYN